MSQIQNDAPISNRESVLVVLIVGLCIALAFAIVRESTEAPKQLPPAPLAVDRQGHPIQGFGGLPRGAQETLHAAGIDPSAVTAMTMRCPECGAGVEVIVDLDGGKKGKKGKTSK